MSIGKHKHEYRTVFSARRNGADSSCRACSVPCPSRTYRVVLCLGRSPLCSASVCWTICSLASFGYLYFWIPRDASYTRGWSAYKSLATHFSSHDHADVPCQLKPKG